MIALAWRQFRLQAVVAFGILALVATVVLVTGSHLAALYDANVVPCANSHDCPTATAAFLRSDHFFQAALPPVLLVAPALIGLFWGAPLVAREFETGTFRLVWTQGVSRRRWLLTRLALVGTASMAVTGLLSLLVGWWFSPIDRLNLNRMSPSVFGVRGITPIGYAAFAFALGVTLGVLVRRTVPAMALTIVGFLGARGLHLLGATLPGDPAQDREPPLDARQRVAHALQNRPGRELGALQPDDQPQGTRDRSARRDRSER